MAEEETRIVVSLQTEASLQTDLEATNRVLQEVKTSQEKFDEKFDDRLKNIEDSMLHFAQWKQEMEMQREQRCAESPKNVDDCMQILRRELSHFKDSSKRSIDQAISLMDMAVFKMNKDVNERVDKESYALVEKTLSENKQHLLELAAQQEAMQTSLSGVASQQGADHARMTHLIEAESETSRIVGGDNPAVDKKIVSLLDPISREISAVQTRCAQLEAKLKEDAKQATCKIEGVVGEQQELKVTAFQAAKAIKILEDAKITRRRVMDMVEKVVSEHKDGYQQVHEAAAKQLQNASIQANERADAVRAELRGLTEDFLMHQELSQINSRASDEKVKKCEGILVSLQALMEQVPTRKELEDELLKIHTAFSHVNENFTRLHRSKADTSLVKELQASLARYSVSQTQVDSTRTTGQSIFTEDLQNHSLLKHPSHDRNDMRFIGVDGQPQFLNQQTEFKIFEKNNQNKSSPRSAHTKPSPLTGPSRLESTLVYPAHVPLPGMPAQGVEYSYDNMFVPTSIKPPPNFHTNKRDLMWEADLRADRSARESFPPIKS